ncbi:diheme cytochrome SoxA (sulfur oxidation) [Ectothiorhodospira mobilis]|uniref:L-cysteine S-thiosulfotransferase subunit SoxA n=1 Tax=Ectothiorhodospira mobilis TaxID=195064 RepID=A0A1I4SKP7_ECTMO|nr:sulfur oxidation c-type cytochrome SoxA [Ectothiorhodospira mobilis]SFM64843.1 diheme cytochrome SoxA (sulfur oxidation) [Ectothiorhodospira mobilis]
MLRRLLWYSILLSGLACVPAVASDSPYLTKRQQLMMLAESNPAELTLWKGEELFHEKRGPKNASLEACDFGLGPGVLEGAYVQMPRYFEDASRVMDLESRIIYCMKTLQGFTEEDEPIARKHSSADHTADLVALYTYIASQSDGMKWDPPMEHPMEKLTRDAGEVLFYRRAGKMDFGCVSCHSEQRKRIRLSYLPSVHQPEEWAKAISWPAYRIGHGVVRSSQHRVRGCYWQMRQAGLNFGSEASIAILSFWTDRARGHVATLPDLKR